MLGVGEVIKLVDDRQHTLGHLWIDRRNAVDGARDGRDRHVSCLCDGADVHALGMGMIGFSACGDLVSHMI